MKSFLLSFAAFFVLQAGLLSAVLKLGCQSPNRFLTLANLKHARLDQAVGPRLILIGGSNIIMGVDSALLKENLPTLEPVSMSLTFGLGLPFHLKEVRNKIRLGDVVLVVPEYETLLEGTRLTPVNAALIAEMVAQRPSTISCLSPGDFRGIMDSGAISLAGEALRSFRIQRVCDHLPLLELSGWLERSARLNRAPTSEEAKKQRVALRQRDRRREAESNEALFRRYNEWGDAVSHRNTPQKEFSLMPIAEVDPRRIDETTAMLNEFASHCRARGANCYLHYPPFPETQGERLTMLQEIDQSLRKDLDIPVLSRPEDSFYPLDRFYNSYYHLGDAYAERTEQLARALQRVLPVFPKRKR